MGGTVSFHVDAQPVQPRVKLVKVLAGSEREDSRQVRFEAQARGVWHVWLVQFLSGHRDRVVYPVALRQRVNEASHQLNPFGRVIDQVKRIPESLGGGLRLRQGLSPPKIGQERPTRVAILYILERTPQVPRGTPGCTAGQRRLGGGAEAGSVHVALPGLDPVDVRSSTLRVAAGVQDQVGSLLVKG